MTRIIHVASGREWRGGQRQVLLLARGLAEVPGLDVTVMTGRGTLLAERLAEARVPTHTVAWGPGLDPRVAMHLVGELTSNTIAHAHDSHAFALADAAARLRRTPVIVTRRDMPRIHNPRRYRRSAAVIAISRAVRQRLIEGGVDAARIHIVPDAVGVDPAAVRAARTVPPGLPVIVCIAALRSVKGIDILLDAAAALRTRRPDARWIVLGEGPERQRLEARRRALGLDEIVDLPGFVAAPEVVLARATIAVQPSRVEALSSSVLDALALGVPVIASDVDGLPEALAKGGGVLVQPDSPVELASAVERLLNSAPERARLGAEGRAAADYFSVDRLVERTVDVYRSMAHYQGAR
jgi:glycosyltransferase involved in cell wall biosynthesis